MNLLPEPDDVDIFVAGGDSDPESVRETVEFVKEFKRRPQHAAEVLAAKEVFDSIKIKPKDYGIDDPAALLDFWRKTVSDLTRDDGKAIANGDGH